MGVMVAGFYVCRARRRPVPRPHGGTAPRRSRRVPGPLRVSDLRCPRHVWPFVLDRVPPRNNRRSAPGCETRPGERSNGGLEPVAAEAMDLASLRMGCQTRPIEPMRDLEIRLALKASLQAQHHGDAEFRMVDELELCQTTARVDLAVINGRLDGYEIKSDRDTLTRLPVQAEIYGRIFDRMTIVAGSRHIPGALARVPAWWRVIEARSAKDGVRLSRIRGGAANPGRDPFAIAALLWREEAFGNSRTTGTGSQTPQ